MRSLLRFSLLSIFLSTTTMAQTKNEIVTIPDVVTGEYTGTIIWGSKPKISQNTKAVVSRSASDEKLVSITFSGGIPGVDASTPQVTSFQFRKVPGTQIDVYESVNVESSKAGVQLSAYMTNLNIVNLVIGGTKIEYTGMKK